MRENTCTPTKDNDYRDGIARNTDAAQFLQNVPPRNSTQSRRLVKLYIMALSYVRGHLPLSRTLAAGARERYEDIGKDSDKSGGEGGKGEDNRTRGSACVRREMCAELRGSAELKFCESELQVEFNIWKFRSTTTR